MSTANGKPAPLWPGVLALVGLLFLAGLFLSVLASAADHGGQATPWVKPASGSCQVVIDEQGRAGSVCE